MKVLIWGCGRLGRTAYQYYKQECNIVGFIDSDSSKWGTLVLEQMVYAPKTLSTFCGTVIIAVKWDYENIRAIVEKYSKNIKIVLFKITEQLTTQEERNSKVSVDDQTIMIYFGGGLGNQMFQYALAKNYLEQGKKVIANIETYYKSGIAEFKLCEIFKNITLDFGGDSEKQEIIEKNKEIPGHFKNFKISIESTQAGVIKATDLSLLDITGGIIYGLHQNYVFAQKVEKKLREDFSFEIYANNKLMEVAGMMRKLNSVSVHIRRGDYLTENNRNNYGNICTEQYYRYAMKSITESTGECVFYFFSNDMNWVKEYFKMENAIYIESNMFENYQDWYDMYLMSQCKHNIIANSTFSWWGAWLNQNLNKIVIAPKKWINRYDYTDIYPNDWITIEG